MEADNGAADWPSAGDCFRALRTNSKIKTMITQVTRRTNTSAIQRDEVLLLLPSEPDAELVVRVNVDDASLTTVVITSKVPEDVLSLS